MAVRVRMAACVLLACGIIVGVGGRVTAQSKKPSSARTSKDHVAVAPPADTLRAAAPLVAIPAQLPDQDSADDRPSFTLDGKRMYFGSRRPSTDPWRRPDPNPHYKWDSDLWYRILTDSGWSRPINCGGAINNSGGQLNPTISPSGNELYYVGGDPVLWKAELRGDRFVRPHPVPGMLNQIYQRRSYVQAYTKDSIERIILKEMEADSDLRERAPSAWQLHLNERFAKHYGTQMAYDFVTTVRCETSMTPDGHFGVISENFGKRGTYGLAGEGGEDLWFITTSPKGEWDSILAFNGRINSEYDETYPFMAADGVTLYFTSNRPCPTCPRGTSGKQDLYRTRFDGTHWTDPVPLGAPFNSPADDYGFSIGPDGETAYFLSNRDGSSRLYQVKLDAVRDSNVAPRPVMVLRGTVTDHVTHRPLRAQIFIDDLDAKTPQFSVMSDSTSGAYVLAVRRGQRLGLQLLANGHLPRSERLTVPAGRSLDRSTLDVELEPERVGATFELKNVSFETGEATLLRESRLELDRVAQYLIKSPNTTLEISGHTDETGTRAFNQTLSQDRAESVSSYLISRGVEPRRLNAIGYGQSRPLAKGHSAADRATNRRVELRVTSASD